MAKIKRHTKKYLIRAGVLFAVFVIALITYFTWTFFNTEKEFTVYSSMEEPTLPVVYAQIDGAEQNAMHGYLQDLGNEAASDSVTVLPSNRKLVLRIAEYNNMVANITYEVRSMDLSHFIEKTEVSQISRDNSGNAYVTLPIQNLIAKDEQYLLCIRLDTGEDSIYYYTKLVWTDHDYLGQMLDFAKTFSEKTFDYNAARELTHYLEINESADNGNLGEVTIHSNFSQLTWGSSGMRRASEPEFTVKEYDGVMGAVEVCYLAERDGETGSVERYLVKDEFTMRMGSDRIYLMNYQRRTNQIFDGSKPLFSGKRILLGITNAGEVQAVKSENQQHVAFKANHELWGYDQKHKRAVNIFSFRSGTDDGVRANYDRHDIKILSVDDNGDIDFVVYGYMNRDRHEGYNGIAYYHYSRSGDTIAERFFIPIAKTFEKIKVEVDELCQKGGNDMFYFKQNNAIAAVDLKSLEMLDIASGLSEGSYAVSADQTKVAWQDGGLYQSSKIQFMDVASGGTQTIAADEGEYLRVLGFSNGDLIYGRAHAEDQWVISNRIKGLPMYRIEIADSGLNVVKVYEKAPYYVESVRQEESRIHLKLYSKEADGSGYRVAADDTIICKEGVLTNPLANLSSYMSDTKKQVYYVELDQDIKTTRNLKISVPRKISYENAGQIEIGKPTRLGYTLTFYSYANGRLIGKANNLSDAISACYEERGWVTDGNGIMVYNRCDRESRREIANPLIAADALLRNLDGFTTNRRAEEEGVVLLDAQGLTLEQVLYYVYQGIPVAAYLRDMDYYLIYAYDNYNVKFYHPSAEDEQSRVVVMGKNDAEQFLTEHQNDFVCAVRYGN